MDYSEIDFDSPAIRALGSLFKLTEVFIRDDGIIQQVPSCPKHIRFIYDDDDDDDDDDVKNGCGEKISSNSSIETTEDSVLMEDAADEFQEMDALGLPLSFRSSKKSSVRTKDRRKLMQRKDQDSQSRLKDQLLSSPKLSEESRSYVEVQDKSSNSSSLSSDHAENSCLDISIETIRLSNSCAGEKPADVAGKIHRGDHVKHIYENVVEKRRSESLTNDLLGTDVQMENKMMSLAGTSDMLKRNISTGGYVIDACVEEHPKDMDICFTKQADTKGSEMANAMQSDELSPSICIEQTQGAGMSMDSQMVVDHDTNDEVSFKSVCGEWSALWDSFYMRYYFYNINTQESTWYPPPGMESFACGDISNVSDESHTEVTRTNVDPTTSQNEGYSDSHEMVDKTRFDEDTEITKWGAQELVTEDLTSGSAMFSELPCALNVYAHHKLDEKCQDEFTLSSSLSPINRSQSLEDGREQENYGDDDLINHVYIEELGTITKEIGMEDTPATRQKKKRKNQRRKKSFNNDANEFQPVEENNVDITKYWCRRYFLFSKFDDGVQMDDEGWFSVTPEAIARHHATRSGGGIVIDCFAGVGGNAIQFAKACKHVIAIDIDPKKIDYAHHNAAIYGVEDQIDFINGDCLSLAPKLKADTLFLSPPWGGPDYSKLKSYDITMLQPYDGQFLFNTFKVTASLIIMFLPKNTDIVQLAELSLSSKIPWSLEVEKNFLNDKLTALTAYFRKVS